MEMSEKQKKNSQEAGREKYLIFSLNEETFGFPLSSIKEVIGPTEITSLPNVPNYFKGLINLRGRIISVLDLKSKLNIIKRIDEKAKNNQNLNDKKCIVIVDTNDTVLGIIVDTVDAVAEFSLDQIERNEENQDKGHRDYISGVAKSDNKKLVLLLKLNKIITLDELTIIKGTHQESRRVA